MRADFAVMSGDDIVGVLYSHESLGRVLVIKGTVNPEMGIRVFPIEGDGDEVKKDMMEFLLEIIPHE